MESEEFSLSKTTEKIINKIQKSTNLPFSSIVFIFYLIIKFSNNGVFLKKLEDIFYNFKTSNDNGFFPSIILFLFSFIEYLGNIIFNIILSNTGLLIIAIIVLVLSVFTHLVQYKVFKLGSYSVKLLTFIIKLVFATIIKYWVFYLLVCELSTYKNIDLFDKDNWIKSSFAIFYILLTIKDTFITKVIKK